MIFTDKLKEKHKLMTNDFDKLWDLAVKNQTHDGDLLMVYINGFYDPTILNFQSPNGKLNPHVIGDGKEGHSEHAHYRFIHQYRTSHVSDLSFSDYKNKLMYSQEKRDLIDELSLKEEYSIQQEMLIYLKFWEADMLIKKFYQLVRLINKEHYDWYFKVSESSRDVDCTGTRQDIIRKMIRDRIQKELPNLYNCIKSTYKTQIRNAIAHSNYSFLGRNIHLNNYIKEDPASQLHALTFDEWINIFHNMIVLHNFYIMINNRINEMYSKFALSNGNTMEIRVTPKEGNEYFTYLEFRPQWNDWKFKQWTHN